MQNYLKCFERKTRLLASGEEISNRKNNTSRDIIECSTGSNTHYISNCILQHISIPITTKISCNTLEDDGFLQYICRISFTINLDGVQNVGHLNLLVPILTTNIIKRHQHLINIQEMATKKTTELSHLFYFQPSWFWGQFSW